MLQCVFIKKTWKAKTTLQKNQPSKQNQKERKKRQQQQHQQQQQQHETKTKKKRKQVLIPQLTSFFQIIFHK